MRKLLLIAFGVLGLGLIVIVTLVLSSFLRGPTDEKIFQEDTSIFRKGVSYSPKNPISNRDFWEKAKDAGSVVRSGGDWIDFNADGKISETVVEFSRQNGLLPIIEVNFFNQDTGELLRPFTEENKNAYKAAAVDFANRFKPPYFGIGVEIDTFERKVPGEFDVFAALFAEVYDAIKEVSPATQVFTTFQYERLNGFGGGIFGGTNDPSAADWQLLDKFPKADFISFTTYPGLIYKNPSDIPADYYSRIKNHTGKPVAFTEIGWFSGANIPGWGSSEAEQAEFINRFFELTSSLDLQLAVWIHIYQQISTEPFATMSLIRTDGIAKPAWSVWVETSR
ncbi:hypothetical protein GTO10_05925 [Candidatus Saccharibacteria bacterium]|nr:hypothetical protein [Candidatus Saccharibacteria bacterium]